MQSGIAFLYIITGIISILIALFLVHLARLSGQAKINADIVKPQSTSILSASSQENKPLNETITEEITRVSETAEQGMEVSKKILDAFEKEINKRISSVDRELNKKYESIIEEKTKDQEVVWKKYNKAIEEKRETDAVIRSVAEGLVVVGKDGKVIMMNPAAEKLLGVSKKDKIGKPITEGVREEQLISLTTTTETGDREIELASPQDETKKILRASSAVIENENGQTVGMVSVLSDITKQKELDRMKSNFVSSVSHELRTPLVAIDKSVSLILSKATGPLTENQEQFLTIAERNLKRLSRLINDLLDLSKLEAGKMELKKETCRIDTLIKETVETFDTWVKTKSINIVAKISDGLPDADIDPDRFTQILTNLIGNSVKFTPSNGTITVEAVFKQGKNEFEVSVKDTGVGIPKESLAKVFDKFYQVKGNSDASGISGTGIGLSVVKELVELHRGRIWVESEKGQGAKFIFTLPK